MTPVIAGVIVAAGASTRMGRPKQLLLVGGKPMLQWVVDAAEASRLDRVVVVTGHAAGEVRSVVRLGRAVWAHNPHPDRGTMSSLRFGIAVAGEFDAVVKLVSDQPEVTAAVIDALLDAWTPGEHPAGVAEYTDGPGHPMLFAGDALAGFIDRDGDRLLWEAIERGGGSVLRLSIDEPRPIDVNTSIDLAAVAARLGQEPSPAPPTA